MSWSDLKASTPEDRARGYLDQIERQAEAIMNRLRPEVERRCAVADAVDKELRQAIRKRKSKNRREDEDMRSLGEVWAKAQNERFPVEWIHALTAKRHVSQVRKALDRNESGDAAEHALLAMNELSEWRMEKAGPILIAGESARRGQSKGGQNAAKSKREQTRARDTRIARFVLAARKRGESEREILKTLVELYAPLSERQIRRIVSRIDM